MTITKNDGKEVKFKRPTPKQRAEIYRRAAEDLIFTGKQLGCCWALINTYNTKMVETIFSSNVPTMQVVEELFPEFYSFKPDFPAVFWFCVRSQDGMN